MKYSFMSIHVYDSSGHSDSVWSVSFSPDGLKVVSWSKDKSIKIWNLKTGDVINTLEGVACAKENNYMIFICVNVSFSSVK